MADHTFYYKIFEAAVPEPLPETLPTTALDAHDGFIHLSTAAQTPITADLFFGQFTKLWILKLRTKDLDGQIRFPADLPGCPHVHGTRHGLGKRNVEAVIVVDRGGHDSWKSVPELNKLES
jgi:uncharacterized protein (DUF952 family)